MLETLPRPDMLCTPVKCVFLLAVTRWLCPSRNFDPYILIGTAVWAWQLVADQIFEKSAIMKNRSLISFSKARRLSLIFRFLSMTITASKKRSMGAASVFMYSRELR